MRVRLPWMSLADRRRWRGARTVTDLGQCMADWLEGRISSQPGYQPNFGPDEETADLVPILAAVNRAGYLTTGSQPGLEGPGFDGSHWRQRAAVDGHISDPVLLRAIVNAADTAGLYLGMQDMIPDRTDSGMVVTTVDSEPYTWFGDRLSYRDLRTIWPIIHREAFHAVGTSVHLTLIAPEFGEDGQYLWKVLEEALTAVADLDTSEPACIVCGCTDATPCPGGCAWVAGVQSAALCTACRGQVPDGLTIHVL